MKRRKLLASDFKADANSPRVVRLPGFLLDERLVWAMRLHKSAHFSAFGPVANAARVQRL
jgi:hypothetical protein